MGMAKRSMVRTMCGQQHKDRRAMDLMPMLGFNEILDQLTMINSVRWYGHVLRRALEFEVEGGRRKGGQKEH